MRQVGSVETGIEVPEPPDCTSFDFVSYCSSKPHSLEPVAVGPGIYC